MDEQHTSLSITDPEGGQRGSLFDRVDDFKNLDTFGKVAVIVAMVALPAVWIAILLQWQALWTRILPGFYWLRQLSGWSSLIAMLWGVVVGAIVRALGGEITGRSSKWGGHIKSTGLALGGFSAILFVVQALALAGPPTDLPAMRVGLVYDPTVLSEIQAETIEEWAERPLGVPGRPLSITALRLGGGLSLVSAMDSLFRHDVSVVLMAVDAQTSDIDELRAWKFIRRMGLISLSSTPQDQPKLSKYHLSLGLSPEDEGRALAAALAHEEAGRVVFLIGTEDRFGAQIERQIFDFLRERAIVPERVLYEVGVDGLIEAAATVDSSDAIVILSGEDAQVSILDSLAKRQHSGQVYLSSRGLMAALKSPNWPFPLRLRAVYLHALLGSPIDTREGAGVPGGLSGQRPEMGIAYSVVQMLNHVSFAKREITPYAVVDHLSTDGFPEIPIGRVVIDSRGNVHLHPIVLRIEDVP